MAKKASDDAKKASDEAKKRAEDAQKKAEEAERKKQESLHLYSVNASAQSGLVYCVFKEPVFHLSVPL